MYLRQRRHLNENLTRAICIHRLSQDALLHVACPQHGKPAAYATFFRLFPVIQVKYHSEPQIIWAPTSSPPLIFSSPLPMVPSWGYGRCQGTCRTVQLVKHCIEKGASRPFINVSNDSKYEVIIAEFRQTWVTARRGHGFNNVTDVSAERSVGCFLGFYYSAELCP